MFVHPCSRHWHTAAEDQEDKCWEYKEEADGGEDGDKLSNQPGRVAAGRKDFKIDYAKKEDAIESTELYFRLGPVTMHESSPLSLVKPPPSLVRRRVERIFLQA